MTCQGAWDTEDSVTSIWHPGGSGAGASTAMYTGERVIIHRVTVTQFRVSRPLIGQLASILASYWSTGLNIDLLLVP